LTEFATPPKNKNSDCFFFFGRDVFCHFFSIKFWEICKTIFESLPGIWRDLLTKYRLFKIHFRLPIEFWKMRNSKLQWFSILFWLFFWEGGRGILRMFSNVFFVFKERLGGLEYNQFGKAKILLNLHLRLLNVCTMYKQNGFHITKYPVRFQIVLNHSSAFHSLSFCCC